MSTTVTCECCGAHGEKSFRLPAPRGWLYMESVELDLETHEPVEPVEQHTMVIFVCSKECAMGAWKSVPALPESDPPFQPRGPQYIKATGMIPGPGNLRKGMVLLQNSGTPHRISSFGLNGRNEMMVWYSDGCWDQLADAEKLELAEESSLEQGGRLFNDSCMLVCT